MAQDLLMTSSLQAPAACSTVGVYVASLLFDEDMMVSRCSANLLPTVKGVCRCCVGTMCRTWLLVPNSHQH